MKTLYNDNNGKIRIRFLLVLCSILIFFILAIKYDFISIGFGSGDGTTEIVANTDESEDESDTKEDLTNEIHIITIEIKSDEILFHNNKYDSLEGLLDDMKADSKDIKSENIKVSIKAQTALYQTVDNVTKLLEDNNFAYEIIIE